jgi:hypothetical protein
MPLPSISVKTMLLLVISDFVGFFQNYPHFFWGGGEYLYVSFFENWEISNNELNVLKLTKIIEIR